MEFFKLFWCLFANGNYLFFGKLNSGVVK